MPNVRVERVLPFAAFVTSLGNNVQLIAGALLVLRADRTMLSVGWLFIAVAAPQVLLSPVFGRWADRFDRRRLWIGSDSISALVALALPIWLHCGGAPAVGVYAANLALAAVSALFYPASAALIKERVAPTRLRHFNANYEMAMQGGMLLSATVGGLCVQSFGAVPLLLVNAGTFVFSAGCVALVGRRPATRPASADRSDPSRTRSSGSGRPPRLFWLILLFAQSSVVVTIFNALLPKLVLGEFHRGAGIYGAVDAVGSLGFLAAGFCYRVLGPRMGDFALAAFGFLLCDVIFVIEPDFGVPGLFVMVTTGAFVFGLARIAARNLLMSTVDPAHTGRVFGTANGAGLAATIAAMLVVAELTDHTDCRYGFAATAVLSGSAALACALRLSGRREARSTLLPHAA
ncbi:MFS transporter [Actinospica durhamensis]|uniref:MFS transporter n=1 Tax=Actinospica durhamensis TaxID=1508375 RepID=A0A941IU24_9ACTN|nr:MFS transporter [Actinospica durhamensis]MBR7836788.1 MFS transporter [Actinospica durhamensis]